MEKIFNIHSKLGKRKDAVRINSYADIPKFLRQVIFILHDELSFQCNGKSSNAPLGSVIGYEKSQSTITGWDCWHIENADEILIEVNGNFYDKSKIVQAMLIPEKGSELPEWVKNCDLTYGTSRLANLKTDSKSSHGRIGIDFLLLYGIKEDGTPDADILFRGGILYRNYFICDENGNDIAKLSDLYPDYTTTPSS